MSKTKVDAKKVKAEPYTGSWISIDGGPYKKCVIRISFPIRAEALKMSIEDIFGKKPPTADKAQ